MYRNLSNARAVGLSAPLVARSLRLVDGEPRCTGQVGSDLGNTRSDHKRGREGCSKLLRKAKCVGGMCVCDLGAGV